MWKAYGTTRSPLCLRRRARSLTPMSSGDHGITFPGAEQPAREYDLILSGVRIAVHEWGHYRVARACGVKVLRFSIGFGRVLWRRVGRDGTEFTLSALPLGGYVRMLDERDGNVAAHEREQAFNQRPLRQRAAIVAAGPSASIVVDSGRYCRHAPYSSA